MVNVNRPEIAMKTMLTALVLSAAVAFAPATLAAGQATPDEAKALALKAADYLKTNGPEKAWAAFNATDGDFHDRDLYVTAEDNNCTVMAHGANAALIGKSLCALRDVDGKAFVQEFSSMKDEGWVDYKWQNPATKTVEPKTAYVVRVGDYVVNVGAYK